MNADEIKEFHLTVLHGEDVARKAAEVKLGEFLSGLKREALDIGQRETVMRKFGDLPFNQYWVGRYVRAYEDADKRG